VAADKGFDVTLADVAEKIVTIGVWGPNARATLQKVVKGPGGLEAENFHLLRSSRSRSAAKTLVDS
jgi:glycine cleavage system aminomethyltransferase T